MRSIFNSCLLCILFFNVGISQSSKPGVFIDCQMYCHINYIKEQITYVNYVQDRQIANIYILATRQSTGAGGSEVQLVFKGNEQFDNLVDTLVYIVDPNATESIEREQMVTELKKGLLKYIIKTDLIDQLNYTVEEGSLTETTEEILDPWNYWVFNIGGNGWVSGEESFNSLRLSSRVSTNRITEDHKFQLSARYNYQKNTYKLTDGEEFSNIQKSYNLYVEYVKSLNDHWSIGGVSRSGSSTFGNTDIQGSIKAAVEYNIFPYADAQTRRFSIFYSVGPEYFDYTEETIYDKNEEWVARHGVTMQFEQTQKWGDLSISMGVQQYFHDLNLYNAYLSPYFEWQVFKGLNVYFSGYFSFVNDRINIAKAYITDEEIILNIKQLDTDFTYYSRFGINYRFGSQYNNFVNPRF